MSVFYGTVHIRMRAFLYIQVTRYIQVEKQAAKTQFSWHFLTWVCDWPQKQTTAGLAYFVVYFCAMNGLTTRLMSSRIAWLEAHHMISKQEVESNVRSK